MQMIRAVVVGAAALAGVGVVAFLAIGRAQVARGSDVPRIVSGRLAQQGRGPATPPAEQAALRRPVSLALDSDAGRLYVANRQSGSVTTLDVAARRVVSETDIGRRLSDLALVPRHDLLLVSDEENHELIVLRTGDDSGGEGALAKWQSIRVAPYPVTVCVSADGRCAYVASLWSRAVSVVNLARTDGPVVVDTISLPFAPREQLLVDGGRRVLVADAFRGDFAVIDTTSLQVQRHLKIPGHNVRGLALSPDGRRVFVSHMILNQLAETTRQSVFWGVVMTNNLRSLSLATLLSDDDPPLKDALVHFLGDPGQATGDPNAVAVCPDGTVVVALGGVDEVGVGRELPYSFRRTSVARRPADVVCDAQGRFGYVANTFSDSITVIDLADVQTVAEIPLGPQPELTLAQRGELLFYDANRSLDGWYSCHSCHTDGYTNGLRVDNLGDGNFGAPKRVLSLLGVAHTEPWAWNGSIERLETQVHKSVVSTMQGPKPSESELAALTAFIRSLPYAPTAAVTDEGAVRRGEAVFESQRCARCHKPPTYSDGKLYDVGLADAQGQRRFNPPSLRGVGHGGPFFHDNSAASLRDVFVTHEHQLRETLSSKQLDDLIAFLRSL